MLVHTWYKESNPHDHNTHTARRSPLHYCGDELPLQMGGAPSTHHQGLWRSGTILLEKYWHGCHVGVHTKIEAKFCNVLIDIINNWMHVEHITTSPYYPQCSVLAKHVNLTLWAYIVNMGLTMISGICRGRVAYMVFPLWTFLWWQVTSATPWRYWCRCCSRSN